MGFPALELLERTEVRIAVVEIGNQTQIDLVIFGVVKKRAAAGVRFREWPANTVYHQTFLVLVRVNFPDFFNADAIMLRIFAFIEAEMRDQLFAEVPTAALGKHRIARV